MIEKKILTKRKSLTYSERLEVLRLTTLAERCIRGDLIKVYKIINSYSDVRSDILTVGNNRNNLLSKFNFMSSNNNGLSKVFQSLSLKE